MAGIKGKSGRKRIPSNEEKEYLEKQREVLVPMALRALSKKVKDGDRDAAKYILDRFMGTPHQSIDHRVKGTLVLTADEYELASRDLIEAETRVLGPVPKLAKSNDEKTS